MIPSKFVSRAQWGAMKPTSVTVLMPSQVTAIAYHYSGSDADEQSDHRNCAPRVRSIQRGHMSKSASDPSKPWSDGAYSYIVCKHGYVFEMRGFERRTAATGPANSYALAVCFLGDDSAGRDDVTAAGRQGLLEITRYIQSKRPLARKRIGHRDIMATQCPGDEIYRYIHSAAFQGLLDVDNTKRLAKLRRWILQQRAYGRSWAWIKTTPNWREFIRRGGR